MAKRPREPSAAKRGLVLDAGAFIALERRSGHVAKLLASLVRAGVAFVTSGGVVAQIWRGGFGSQVPVGLLLAQVEIVPLDGIDGKLVGMVLARSGARDPVDGHVALLAHERSWPVLTSDPADLRAIDPTLDVIVA